MILHLLLIAAPSIVGLLELHDNETVQVGPRLPRTTASAWILAGYDRGITDIGSYSTGSPPAVVQGSRITESKLGVDFGADLFVRVAGPVYLGAIVDYALSGPNALLVAGGARVVFTDVAVSGGFGYSSVGDGGIGALAAVELSITDGVALRAQGSWRHSSYTMPSGSIAPGADASTTVWSILGGLSLRL
jgi:hypothetical protein